MSLEEKKEGQAAEEVEVSVGGLVGREKAKDQNGSLLDLLEGMVMVQIKRKV